jgi:hypothetical protein
VQRIWRARKPQLDRLRTLQALARPQLVAKLTDNVGLGACPRADGWH